MNQTKPTLTLAIIGVLFLGLSSCATLSRDSAGDRDSTGGSTPTSPTSSPASATPQSPQAALNASPRSSPDRSPVSDSRSRPTNPVSVTIYKVDDQCQELVSQEVEVAGDRPIEAAIGKVLEGQNNANFKLTGYRVRVADGVAIVDFRLAPDSRRKLISLSACEQLALFGSLEETLTQNPEWQIKSVEFTERGERIAL
jgi:Sporulation and spore germination